MVERNAEVAPAKRIEFRIGIHLGDVVEESDRDLMGDGVNIVARLEGIAKPGAICPSEQAYWQVKQRLDLKVSDLGLTQLKNIVEPVNVYSLEVGQPKDNVEITLAQVAQGAESVHDRRLKPNQSFAFSLVADASKTIQLQRTLPQRSRQHHWHRLRPQRSNQQRRQRTSVRSLLRLVITLLAGGTVIAADVAEEPAASKRPASPSAMTAFCMTVSPSPLFSTTR
jgi:Adenylate and Guanylate cyclase catalytic domain